MRTRNHEIKVRFNDEELADLNAKVAKTRYNRENYIRAVLAGYEIMEAPDVETKELLDQIRRLGNRNLFYHRRAYFSLCVGKSLQLYEQRPEQPSVAG